MSMPAKYSHLAPSCRLRACSAESSAPPSFKPSSASASKSNAAERSSGAAKSAWRSRALIRIRPEYGIWGLLKHLLDRADEIFVDAYQTAVGRQLELLALLGPHDVSLENHRAVGS